MPNPLSRLWTGLDLEERILHAGSFIAFIGTLLPWISGEWLGSDQIVSSGLGFLTAPFGWMVFLLNFALLLLTYVPLLGGKVLVRRSLLPVVRLLLSAESLILTFGTLATLINVTFEYSRMEVRFGIYISLIGSLVATLYSFLQWQQQRKRDVQELFHHPEQKAAPVEAATWRPTSPPPPPPPPLQPEEHHLHHV